MKKLIVGIVVLAFLAGTGLCFAEADIPSMVGTWSIKSEGAVIAKKDSEPGAKTHHSGDFSSISAEVVVTKQKGRVFHGTFTTSKGSEAVIGVIGMDNKSIFTSDEDGFSEGKIVGKNKITCVYRHSTPADSVIAVATWTRKK